ncbi:hypothetical protein ACFZB6_25410 [Streptomyces syringium]|uniref:hypothetical protein n=1 Tax=Streptomyces syringium TaxID=76729 RepID=UPI0033DFE4CD
MNEPVPGRAVSDEAAPNPPVDHAHAPDPQAAAQGPDREPPADPVRPQDSPSRELPMPRAQPYVPIATLTLPGRTPSIDTVGNLIVGPTGPINVSQTYEVRTADLLETVLVSREHVLSDASYVEAEVWREVRRRAAGALAETSVLFLVAPRRHGATTFSLRLLAEATEETVALQVVEPSWDRPLVSKLPVQPDSAYLLDFQDPERDRIDRSFLTGLEQHARNLGGIGSRLVITITPELWSHVAGQVPAGPAVVRLSSHPKADQVARAHLLARGHTGLTRYLDDPTVRDGIEAWTPARAVWLVDEMIDLAQEHARTAAEEGAALADHEDRLRSAVRELAQGWATILGSRFADSTRPGVRGPAIPHDNVAPLDVEDRCLSLALAVRGSGPVTRIQADAERLAGVLAGAAVSGAPKNGERKGPVDLTHVLGGVGLRTRFENIGADVRFGEAEFTSPTYGDALLTHIWDQYHPLHERLIGWMVSCGEEDGRAAGDDPAVRAILGVLTYHQDDSQLAEVRKQAAALGKTQLATAVMAGAARDEHLGRRARQLLYTWAGQKDANTQRLVVAVCRELLDDQPVPALTRLRRVADNRADEHVTADVLRTFKEVANVPRLTGWFAESVTAWQHQAGSGGSRAANLGTLALMSVDAGNRPWLLTGAAPELDVTAALRELFADLDENAEVIDELTRWLRADGGALHDQVLSLFQDAVSDRVGFRALARLINELGKVRRPDGSDPGTQLRDLLGDDPDLGELPLRTYPA